MEARAAVDLALAQRSVAGMSVVRASTGFSAGQTVGAASAK